jgi:acyl-CoA reductase-like NAD-dependent aldehyde dehydrogenase
MQKTDVLSASVATSTDEMRQVISTARQAQQSWATQPLRARLAVIKHMRHALARHASTLATAVQQATSRSVGEALAAEVLPLLDACRFLERNAVRLLRPRRLGYRHRPWWLHGVKLEVHREPFGVVLIIAPANYPLLLPGVQLIQALVAGNAVLLKPAEAGVAVANMLSQVLSHAGLDTDLLRLLSPAPQAAQAAIAVGVDKTLLTGSTATGHAVLHDLADSLTPAVFELSGCDAAFVCSDANPQQVSQALAFSLRFNHGATCIAPRRVFVPSEMLATLETHLLQAVDAIAPGPVAPAMRLQLRELVADACANGARQLTGHFHADHQVSPFIISHARPSMRLLQTDIFAPLLALVPVAHEEMALAASAQCPYALGATVFGPERQALDLAKRIHAGVVVVNDVIVPTADPRLPFGGRGRSGFGVTRGAEGLLELTHIKALSIRRGRWRPHYEPVGHQHTQLFEAYIHALHGNTWAKRSMAVVSAMRTMRRASHH